MKDAEHEAKKLPFYVFLINKLPFSCALIRLEDWEQLREIHPEAEPLDRHFFCELRIPLSNVSIKIPSRGGRNKFICSESEESRIYVLISCSDLLNLRWCRKKSSCTDHRFAQYTQSESQLFIRKYRDFHTRKIAWLGTSREIKSSFDCRAINFHGILLISLSLWVGDINLLQQFESEMRKISHRNVRHHSLRMCIISCQQWVTENYVESA